MNKAPLEEALYEAKRFLSAAIEAHKRLTDDAIVAISGSKETAACRRASMDLSRKLTELRKTQ